MASRKSVKSRVNRQVAKVIESDGDLGGPCAFCHRNINNELLYGKLYSIGDLHCHYFCVLLSCCLIQKGEDNEGLLGFLYTDIRAEIERSKKHRCSYCGKGGATLGCSVSACRKQFHLPCGHEKNAVSMFYGNYKSYCEKHAPCQKIDEGIMSKAKPRIALARKIAYLARGRNCRCPPVKKFEVTLDVSPDDAECICVICYEVVEGYPSTRTFWPPCCARDKWLHRTCLQRMALSAGMHYLKCPLCNDKQTFYTAVVSQGYYVPDRDAAWELEQNAFSEIYERELKCGAAECVCPAGRRHDQDAGDWDIKLCLVCGTTGIHPACITEHSNKRRRYVCEDCLATLGDRERIENTVEELIKQEELDQEKATPERDSRPVMPARMSIRRTKPRPQLVCRDTTRAPVRIYQPENSANNSASIQSNSHDSVRRRHPTGVRPGGSDGIRPVIGTKIHSKQKPDPGFYRDERAWTTRINARQMMARDHKYHYQNATPSNTETSRLELNLKPPKRQCVNQCDVDQTDVKNTDVKPTDNPQEYMSPLKTLEIEMLKKLTEKHVDMNCEDFLDKIRSSLKRPRPMCAKKKIVENILNKVLRDMYEESPTKRTSAKKRATPRKSASHQKENTETNRPMEQETTKTPKKEVFIENDTPSKEKNVLNTNIRNDKANIDEPTPKKRKTIDVQNDSNIEISAQDETVNIDHQKIEPQNNRIKVSIPLKNEKCLLKVNESTEKLDKYGTGVDLEIFKNEYLNEVGREHKCSYKHKHDDKDTPRNTKLKTAIDFAVEAALNKEKVNKKQKRKKKSKKRSPKIKLTFKGDDKIRRLKSKKNLSIKNQDIKVKIKWQKEQLDLKIINLKYKNNDKESADDKVMKQTILNFSPENDMNREVIVKPVIDVTPRKRIYNRNSKLQDNLKQTSIQSFFKTKTD